MNDQTFHATVRCPRCGYDQRGVVATWMESCPLQGTCSECGLEFNWAEVIVPEKFEPRWCVEFVSRWRDVPKACAATLIRSFRPWRFWGQMRMSQTIRPGRLMSYAFLLVLSFAVLYVPSQVFVALRVRGWMLNQLIAYRASIPQQIASLQQQALQPGVIDRFGSMTDAEKQLHQQRLQLNLTFMQALVAAPPPSISESAWILVAEAVFTPTAQSSRAIIDYGGGVRTAPYIAPASLWPALANFTQFSASTYQDDAQHIAYGLACSVVLLLFMPAGMALLPQSRRKAKVRWPHIWRITIYSLFIPWTIVLVTVLTYLLWPAMARDVHLMMWIAVPLWWAAGIRLYLRIPHAEGIVLALTVIIVVLMVLPMEPVLPRWFARLILV